MRTQDRPFPGELSDETLIARVAQSDGNALEALYDRYAPMVMGISLKITSDPAAAEEVLKETFWQVWQGAAGFQLQSGSFTGWLFSIDRRLALDAHRWKLSRK